MVGTAEPGMVHTFKKRSGTAKSRITYFLVAGTNSCSVSCDKLIESCSVIPGRHARAVADPLKGGGVG